jgi:hypothetical protein
MWEPRWVKGYGMKLSNRASWYGEAQGLLPVVEQFKGVEFRILSIEQMISQWINCDSFHPHRARCCLYFCVVASRTLGSRVCSDTRQQHTKPPSYPENLQTPITSYQMLFSLGKIVALELADHRHTVIFGRNDNFITLCQQPLRDKLVLSYSIISKSSQINDLTTESS